VGVCERSAIPHLTPALSAPGGGEGKTVRRPVRRIAGLSLIAAAVLAVLPGPHPAPPPGLAPGENPDPVRLVRPPAAPLSAMAALGRRIFFDPSLSSSGRLACVSCHTPQRAYGPPGHAPVMMGGPGLSRPGVRAVPSLMYLERQPNFDIGPDDAENETVSLAQRAAAGSTAAHATKTARDTAAGGANLVPQGGLFWDGRADTLQQQALYPLLSPFEMDGGSVDRVAAKLRRAPYAARFAPLFGSVVFDNPRLLVAEALFAVGRYEIEAPSFHPYTSKFDFWLEGRARLSPAELRGYRAFNDPQKANCGGCHLDRPSGDGLPPLFTDHQFEALGAPRNSALAASRDPAYYDLGICGPWRTDLRTETQYCGMFATPTLRNVATRNVFFHNGVYRSLPQVLDFYDFRDTEPQRIYPRRADGTIAKFDDMPPRYRGNIDTTDPPFDRKEGEAPAMTRRDERDIIAFLGALTDGWQPPGRPASADR
jgi:cytochrome c peroxidase